MIRRHFQPRGSVFKPVVIEPFDDNDRWRWYTLKIPNTRKIRRSDEHPTDGGERQKGAVYRELRKAQHLQQALLLHNLGWSGRFYLRGAAMEKSARGIWRLVRT